MALFKRKRADGSRHDNYSFFLRHKGKVIFHSTGTGDKEEASRIYKEAKKGLKSVHAAAVLVALQGAMLRRVIASIADVVEAYHAPGLTVLKSATQARRNTNDLYLVLAWALDLWVVHDGSVKRQGTAIGERVPDRTRINKLSCAVLDGALVKRYFSARCEGGVIDWSEAADGNVSINSTLEHARDVFRGKARALKLDHLALPDLTPFMKHPLLPVEMEEPEPLSGAQVIAMLGAWDTMQSLHGIGPLQNGASNQFDFATVFKAREICLINWVLRETGIRSGSLAQIHPAWVKRLQNGFWLEVRDRKGKTRLYSVPLSDELGTRLCLGGCIADDGYLIQGATPAARARRVQDHNAWLKGVIGSPVKGQGNHRLRDTLATALLSMYGPEVAAHALGHENVATTLRHYGRLQVDVPARLQEALRVFARLRPAKTEG